MDNVHIANIMTYKFPKRMPAELITNNWFFIPRSARKRIFYKFAFDDQVMQDTATAFPDLEELAFRAGLTILPRTFPHMPAVKRLHIMLHSLSEFCNWVAVWPTKFPNLEEVFIYADEITPTNRKVINAILALLKTSTKIRQVYVMGLHLRIELYSGGIKTFGIPLPG
jgi:hypothetical protein